MIDDKKIEHIADLAKLYIRKDEYPKYKKQLTDILTEIEKIVDVSIKNDEIMISPTNNENCYSEDIIEQHISRKDAFLNAKSVKGDYITVPNVIEGEN